MCGRLPCVFVLWSGARQPPTPLSLCIDSMVTPIPPSRRRSIRSRIHPLLLLVLVVVLVTSRSLVVVAISAAEERPCGGRCLSHLRSFLGWRRRTTTTTWFYPDKARYFRASNTAFMGGNVTFMDGNVSFYGWECLFLWMKMSLLWMRMSLFMDENVLFYG